MRAPICSALALLAMLLPVSAREPIVTEPWIPEGLSLSLDGNLSPEAGADDLLALRYTLGRVEDRLIKPRWWPESRFWPHFGGFGYRLGRMVWLDLPLSYMTTVLQHEYFGHGFRGREEGFSTIRYEFGLPPPFAGGGGSTSFQGPLARPNTWDWSTLVNMGGEEAEGVEADRLRALWVQSGSVDARGALGYLLLRNSLRHYLAVSDEAKLDEPDPDYSNDMLSYVYDVNTKQTGRVGNRPLGISRIEEQYNWSLIDPFLWYSVWGIAVTHLWEGQSFFRYPAVPLGPVRYLPAVGYGLGPWGPEYRVENLLGWDGRGLDLAYRFGDDTFRRSWGWDVQSIGMARAAGCIFDMDAHFWQQPRLRLDTVGTTRGQPRKAGFAGAVSVLSPMLPVRWPLRLSGGAGWKTAGWVRGKELGEGAYWRIGLAWTPGRPVAVGDSTL